MKTWLIVRELDGGRLIVEDDQGHVITGYDRTKPADESRDENWSHELVTDIAGLARAAMTLRTKSEGHDKSRFNSSPTRSGAGAGT